MHTSNDGDVSPSTLADVVSMVAKQAMPYAAKKLGVPERDLWRHVSAIQLDDNVDCLEINACCKPTGADGTWNTFGISVNLGAMMFFHKMVKVLVTGITMTTPEGVVQEASHIAFDERAAKARYLIEEYWRQFTADRSHYVSGGFSARDMTHGQLVLAARLLNYAECFLMGHEIGHAIIHLHPNAQSLFEVRDATRLARDIFENDIDAEALFPGVAKDLVIASWTEEFAADLIGLFLSLSMDKGKTDLVDLRYSGAELALIMLNMLWRYGEERLGKPLLEPTHPPISLRLKSLRSAMNSIHATKNPDEGSELAEDLEVDAEMLLRQRPAPDTAAGLAELPFALGVKLRRKALRGGVFRETARVEADEQAPGCPLMRVHVCRMDGEPINSEWCITVLRGLIEARKGEKPFALLLKRLGSCRLSFDCEVIGFSCRFPGGIHQQTANLEIISITQYPGEAFKMTGHSLSVGNIDYRVYFYWR